MKLIDHSEMSPWCISDINKNIILKKNCLYVSSDGMIGIQIL